MSWYNGFDFLKHHEIHEVLGSKPLIPFLMEFQLINLVHSNLDWDKNKIHTYLNIQFSFKFHQSHKIK